MESTINSIFTPNSGRILIEPQDITSKTGMQLNESAVNSNIGVVIAVGEDYITHFGATIKAPCKVGDLIQHSETTGVGTQGYQNISINNKPYRIVLFDSVMGVYKNE